MTNISMTNLYETLIYERRLQPAVQIFDLKDHYMRERGVQGPHPRPIEPILFYAMGQVVGGDRQLFAAPQRLVIRRNPSGYHLFFGTVRLAGGEVRSAFQTDGIYIVRVESRYYQPLEVDLQMPMTDPKKPADLVLLPGYAYPFPRSVLPGGGGPTLLRGSVVDANDRGLGRVTIEVIGQESIVYFTDSSGQWVLVFPDNQPAGPISLRLTTADGTSEVVNNVSITQGQQSSLPPVVLAP